jgi:positive regulator of sigma E activity
MRERALVKGITPDNLAIVVVQQNAGCGESCGSCRACGSRAQGVETEAVNAAGAAPGDMVLLETSSARVILMSVVFFISPVLFPFAFFQLSRLLAWSVPVSGIMAALGLAAAFAVIRLVSNKVSAAPPAATVVRVEWSPRD